MLRPTAVCLAAALLACAPTSAGSGPVAGSTEPPPAEPIFYVDAAHGSDSNDGRRTTTAFQTLQRAAAAVKPGWTVKVLTGTYTSDGTAPPLTITSSGTADAWITFAAETGHHPVIQIPRGPGAWAGIDVLGASYIVVDGFEIAGQGPSITKQEALANDGTQPLYNHNCIYVDGVGFAGTRVPVPHDIVIRNCWVHGCTAAGIEVNAADAVTIQHNKVQDTSWWTVFDTSGIGLYHLTDAPGSTTKNGYRNFIVGNEVWGNRNEVPTLGAPGVPRAIYDGNGIIVDDSRHTQAALGPNDVQDVPYLGRTYIANNIVHDNGGRGIHLYRSQHVDVANNTTFNNLLTTSDYLTWGEIDGFQSDDVQFVNNVCVNLVGKDVTFDDGNRYDYNLYDGASAPYRGPHDVLAPALLADPAHGNFTPQTGSPAVKSGTAALAPADDFFGNPRPASAIDRGAVQVSR